MTQHSVTDEAAVRTVLERLYGAWADHDANAFAARYTDDATVVMPGVHHRGKDEVRAYMAAAFAGPLAGSRAIDEPRSIRFLGSGAAVVVSEGGIVRAGQSESAVPVRATWVLSRQDGTWLVAAYHNCPC
ncbi:MAG: SgcJ/EcaC family oxidoreductase [Actinomycetota bacterium]|nr:SgcJ/EcaC family oxidoreductase [Actinomycetota bacterium]